MTHTALRPTAFQDNEQRTKTSAAVGYWLSFLILCLLPLERWTFPSNLKVVDFALVLLILYALAKSRFTGKSLRFPLIVPMWLILVASLFATLVGGAHPNSIVAVIQEVYLLVAFLGLTNVLVTLSSSDLDRLMKLWGVVAVAEATAVLMGMIGVGPSIFFTSPTGIVLSTAGFNRAIGTYLNPNAVAAYLSISFFVLWATSWPVSLRLLLSLWISAGIFATGSMGALVSTVISLTGLIVLYISHKGRWARALWGALISIGAGVIIALLMVISPWSLAPSASRFVAETEVFSLTVWRLTRSLSGRFALLRGAWSIYRQYPLGTGPNTSLLYVSGSLHNDYVAFLFERGPLGAIGWLWLIAATLLAPLNASRAHTDNRKRWQILALGAGFLACAINAFSHEVSHFRQMWVLMAFIFATSQPLLAGFPEPSLRESRMTTSPGPKTEL